MYPVEPIGGGAAPSQIDGASSRQRCGNDGQRKRVAHMPTATTTKEDSRSKLVQNHPHDFTKKLNSIQKSCTQIRYRNRVFKFGTEVRERMPPQDQKKRTIQANCPS